MPRTAKESIEMTIMKTLGLVLGAFLLASLPGTSHAIDGTKPGDKPVAKVSYYTQVRPKIGRAHV